MGCGQDIAGINSTKTNTNGKWEQIVTGPSGNPLDSIVKIHRNYNYLYALDSYGSVYYINAYPEKISTDSESEVKFKDIGSTYIYNGVFMTYLISEDGYVYKGKGTDFDKIEGIIGAQSIHISHNSLGSGPISSMAIILDKYGQAYYGDQYGNVTKIEGVTDVISVYGGHCGFYFKFSSGRIGYTAKYGSNVTILSVPEGEEFINIFGTDQTVIGLLTDKKVYQLTGTALKEVSINWNNDEDNSNRRIIYSHGDLAVDNYGKYYTWTFSNSCFNMNPIEGIEKWSNLNPIISDSDLANFKIPVNEIYDRLEINQFKFDLVAKKAPIKFNFYYTKTSDRNNKEKWVKIEENVDTSTLSEVSYDTGYIDSKGVSIIGYSYTYNWSTNDSDELSSVYLIAEPIFD